MDLSLAANVDAGGEQCNVTEKSNNNELACYSERPAVY
jgi:hypothetical protein